MRSPLSTPPCRANACAWHCVWPCLIMRVGDAEGCRGDDLEWESNVNFVNGLAFSVVSFFFFLVYGSARYDHFQCGTSLEIYEECAHAIFTPREIYGAAVKCIWVHWICFFHKWFGVIMYYCVAVSWLRRWHIKTIINSKHDIFGSLCKHGNKMYKDVRIIQRYLS